MQKSGLPDYLTTEEAALYLRLSERKLYELVANGAVPCSKVTGKWLFPRVALDRWIASGLASPEGLQLAAPAPIIGGSHDPLLEWVVRRADCGLALLSEGSLSGLDRLERDEVAMAAIHLHAGPDDADDADANVVGLRARSRLADAVLIGFARREQGLMVAPGNPLALESLADAVARRARFGLRQPGAGARMLLDRLLAAGRLDAASLAAHPRPHPTGQDLAVAIRAGELDCGIATRAVAQSQGLGFVPLAWERFDLAMRRRTAFEPAAQALFARMREGEFVRQAQAFGGYDVSGAGTVRLNR
jgi:excisionase family DNA binding protein